MNSQYVWVKFNKLNVNEPIFQIPESLYPSTNKIRWLHFGLKKEKCLIETTNQSVQENSYEKPIHLFISSVLMEKLAVPMNLIYKLRITTQRIEIGPTIGLLLGDRNHLYHPDYMEKYSDRFGIAANVGGLAIAFSLRSLDWENEIIHGFIFDQKANKWIFGKAAIPNVIYRRNFHQKTDVLLLRSKTKDKFFNSIRYSKWELYNMLQKNPDLLNHLPKTFLLQDFGSMIEYLHHVGKIILKPTDLSRGRGILIIEINNFEEGKYLLHDYRDKERPMSYSLSLEKLLSVLKNDDFINKMSYLYQTYIPLAKINHSPFDIRVVMQKDHQKKWKCNGIECRIAGDREQITNISRGGQAKTLEETVKLLGPGFDYEKIYAEVLSISHHFCNWMDMQGEHFAEFGLDIGLDMDGFLWFIEANVFPSFKGFKSLDYSKYLRIRHQPLIYASSIQGFHVEEEVG